MDSLAAKVIRSMLRLSSLKMAIGATCLSHNQNQTIHPVFEPPSFHATKCKGFDGQQGLACEGNPKASWFFFFILFTKRAKAIFTYAISLWPKFPLKIEIWDQLFRRDWRSSKCVARPGIFRCWMFRSASHLFWGTSTLQIQHLLAHSSQFTPKVNFFLFFLIMKLHKRKFIPSHWERKPLELFLHVETNGLRFDPASS